MSSQSTPDSLSAVGHVLTDKEQVPDQDSQAVLAEKRPDASYEVTLEPEDDPQQKSLFRRWITVVVIAISAVCIACASSAAAFTEAGVTHAFGVSRVVSVLGVSLFVQGLGVGPLVVGPLSEVYGRQIIYKISLFLSFALTWPVAFAPNIVFRFLSGLFASSYFCVTGGSMSDMFNDAEVATPMAFNTIAPFFGPELQPIYSGFINQNTNWRWTYYTLLIWMFVQLVVTFLLTEETYIPIILKHKAQKYVTTSLEWKSSDSYVRLRKATGDPNYYAPIERENKDLLRAIRISCSRPFQVVFFDRMVLLLNLWNSVLLGIVYLTFQAFPIIFDKHGFNLQMTGLTFTGILSGIAIGMCTQPYINWKFRKDEQKYGELPIEYRLWTGQVGGVIVPISLFWLAFTTYPSVHWIVPILASVPFGTGMYYIYTSTFTYLVVAYRPISASVLASNATMRTSFAAGFPLFANAMYDRLGTVGATALLAGLMTVMAPLP
ncbi:hypothetical protein EWM64_g7958 [Hericium alpestre]|uniref:Major facilitator superfamily (MFS) profile domain-containing protein n=1 Tax=Hericium alpestre TaxID=135208 RepID=A0A4Y9ZP67_9AGAM|nr:hypothetical protein EWM64_g7958 [Hericium alpestre]